MSKPNNVAALPDISSKTRQLENAIRDGTLKNFSKDSKSSKEKNKSFSNSSSSDEGDEIEEKQVMQRASPQIIIHQATEKLTQNASKSPSVSISMK